MVVAIALFAGCDASSRYAVLSTFFDGVPPPQAELASAHAPAGVIVLSERQTQLGKLGEHGPYAAKQCGACHSSTSNNSFVAPREQLCFRCHDLKLDKKFIHGPLASGGCTVCHDPHSSKYGYLLVADSGTFCLHCHNAGDLEKVSAHRDSTAQCLSCHDPHMSDHKYLVR